jgi:hypothetical protein
MDQYSIRVLFMIVIIIFQFLVVSVIVMEIYNYTMPKLLMSINNNYKSSDFTRISFKTGCILVLVYNLLFGSSIGFFKVIPEKVFGSTKN